MGVRFAGAIAPLRDGVSFNELVFDDWVSGTGTVYTPDLVSAVLGRPERLLLHAVAGGVAGTNPSLTVQIETAGDDRQFGPKNSVPEIRGVPLSSGSTNSFFGSDPSTGGGTGLAGAWSRLAISLAGTNPRCRLKIYATGRRGNVLSGRVRFSRLVFDDWVYAGRTAYTAGYDTPLLGSADELQLHAVAGGVKPGNIGAAMLSVQIEMAGDDRSFIKKNASPEINSASLTATSVNSLFATDAGTTPSAAFVRLAITMPSTGSGCKLKIYVTGRERGA